MATDFDDKKQTTFQKFQNIVALYWEHLTAFYRHALHLCETINDRINQ